MTIRGLKPPASLTELSYFIEVCNAFRRFLSKLAQIESLLNQRLKKDQPATLLPINIEEFHIRKTLKTAFTSPPVPVHSYVGGHLTLDAKTCNAQTGAVFHLKQPSEPMKPAGYWSRSLTKIQLWYDSMQRERLAFVSFVLHSSFDH